MNELASPAASAGERTPVDQPTRPAPAAPGRPLAVYLILLGFAIAVPALIFSGYLLYRFAGLEREAAVRGAQDTAASIRDTVDREIGSMITQLNVLSTSSVLENGDFGAFHQWARTGLVGSDVSVGLIDTTTDTPLLSTRIPYGTPLPPPSNRTVVDEAVRKGGPYVSDVFFGKTANEFVFSVSLPVTTKSGRHYVLVMTRGAASLTPIIREQNLAPGWQGTVIDREGKVLASTAGETIGGPAQIQIPGLSRGNIPPTTIELNGKRIVFAVRPSFDTGWRVAAWVPAAVVEEPLWNSMTLLGFVGVILLLLTAILAVTFGRRVSRPVLQLAGQGRALGRGEVFSELATPVREVNEVSRTLATAADERHRAESHIRFLMRELSHRAKNQLAVVVAMARRTAETNKSVAEFENVFSERLRALARSTDLLVHQNWSGVGVEELVRAHLMPFAEPSRLMISGPAIELSPDAAQNIGLALHELATNAAKYGSLLEPNGTVSVTWRVIVGGNEPRFLIEWVERGGPAVKPPTVTGFGSVVIQRTVAHSLNADVTHEFPGEGVFWSLELPLSAVAALTPKRETAGSAA